MPENSPMPPRDKYNQEGESIHRAASPAARLLPINISSSSGLPPNLSPIRPQGKAETPNNRYCKNDNSIT